MGNGDGSFQAPLNFPAGVHLYSVAVGDFNGDGWLDLAVANGGTPPRYLDAGISVLLGNGDGSFQAARSFGAGSGPSFVAVGDFNGDGVPDLAVINTGAFRVSVLLGNGDGSFKVARSFEAGSYSRSIAVGDFNGDGVPDLALTNGVSNSASVLLGNGDGSFQAARSFGAGNFPISVVVGDFNGDGVPDLAVANSSSTIYGGTVSVLLGKGDGSFKTAQSFGAGGDPTSVTVADFNGDGVPDLAVANYYTNNVSVLLGNGDGSFQAPRSFGAGHNPSSLAVGDFNGDGMPDLAVTDDVYPSGAGTVSVLINNTPQ